MQAEKVKATEQLFELILVIGETGTGKTYWIRNFLKEQKGNKAVFCIDKAEYQDFNASVYSLSNKQVPLELNKSVDILVFDDFPIVEEFYSRKTAKHLISSCLSTLSTLVLKKPFSVIFPDYQTACKITRKWLYYTQNIDIGLMQINYLHWLRPHKIPFYEAFIPEKAFSLAEKIIKTNYRETGNYARAVGYYHSRRHYFAYMQDVMRLAENLMKEK